MDATVHPDSLASGGPAAALPGACASSRVRINPACVAKPAAAKKPKRPAGSLEQGDPPAKSARGASGEVASAAAAAARNKNRPGPSPISGVEALRVTKNQTSASPTEPPETTAPPKPPASSMRELLEKARLAENQTSASSLRPLACCSMRELLEKARLAKARIAAADSEAEAEAIHRREIERRRAEARREREQMVQTVEFNDPFIDFRDVFK